MVAIRYAAILCASAAFIPAAMAQTQTQPPQQQTAQNECQRLEQMIQQRRSQGDENIRIDMNQVRTWQREQNNQACRDALRQMQTAGGQQQQQGQQAQITVQQPPAQVEIQQGQPEILVHQPAPRVTVEIPQPQITVRMPQPQAQVSQAAPQVQVQQPQPTVEVEQAQQEAQVQVQRGQPQVRYEAEEPQVEIKRAEGQPEVQIEQVQPGQQQKQQQARQQPPQQQAQQQQAQQQPPQQAGQGQQMPVSELKGTDVYNAQGEQIGSVEQVIVDSKGDNFIVMSHGGFLGLGDKKVALPIDQLWVSGDRLMIRGLSDDQVRDMPAWEGNVQGVRELEDDQRVQVSQTQQ